MFDQGSKTRTTRARRIINRYKRYVRKRNVQAIIVKVSPVRRHTRAIKLILKRIEALAKKHNCMFDLITKREMRHKLHLHVHSADMLAECARVFYPDLGALYHRSITRGIIRICASTLRAIEIGWIILAFCFSHLRG
ncbi:hypothetical protein BEL04_11020 [Mucilaginibacter sp. PPCGB 2223]|uniref:hypothetical protein n=1 Tax=Mucilaginibacter sp. PPCGB 2223 TaxID=1886027 RepID=UPI0008250ACF|nr:hypothetical protein [Mucilaginibacter sp. PPCGB 2223]OCX52032.1 hypothetical protein BEL04_11020 [Mucilaginibacter sp. PPCGB 2223]